MSHQDLIGDLPLNFKVIARSENNKVAAMVNREKKIYGIQFHPEVNHTPLGKKLLENFLLGYVSASLVGIYNLLLGRDYL